MKQCEVKGCFENGRWTIFLTGEITHTNAPEMRAGVERLLAEHPAQSLVLDCDRLSTTSSAGLRVILRLKQQVDDIRIVNAHSELYDILDMTVDMEAMKQAVKRDGLAFEEGVAVGEGDDKINLTL